MTYKDKLQELGLIINGQIDVAISITNIFHAGTAGTAGTVNTDEVRKRNMVIENAVSVMRQYQDILNQMHTNGHTENHEFPG